MRKTLLLVFIHGFKGGDDTFGTFPEHLRALVSHAQPNIDVRVLVYPRFETRGELKECVARFREWLQNKVIDIEVEHSAPSPTIDPSVHTILVGHSMGGIVAAETFLLIASEQPIPISSSSINPETPNFPSNTTLSSSTGTSHPHPSNDPSTGSASFLFPHIQGLLAFDTPFLGLAPGMVAHSLEGGHKMATGAYNTYNEVASVFGWGSKSEASVPAAVGGLKNPPRAALPAPTVDAAAAPKWQSWGKYAMFAGAAGAVAAGGAAALYSQREKISAGWSWASSHLLFVGDLARVENLRRRVESVEKQCQDRGLGCANLYTNLGRGAREGYGITASVAGKERTFCNLPSKVRLIRDGSSTPTNVRDEKKGGEEGTGMKWMKAINEKAKDETSAHMNMFTPRDNPGFYALGEDAKALISSWVDVSWYNTSDKRKSDADTPTDSSTPRPPTMTTMTLNGDEGWEKPDDDLDHDHDQEQDHKDDNVGKDWEGLDPGKENDDDDDVRMRDEDEDDDEYNDKENTDGRMETSVIVDTMAANGEIPLPESRDSLAR